MAAVEVAPAIPGFSPEQNGSLQQWVMGIVNERMRLASTAVDFINELNDKQTEAVAAIALEAGATAAKKTATRPTSRLPAVGRSASRPSSPTSGR